MNDGRPTGRSMVLILGCAVAAGLLVFTLAVLLGSPDWLDRLLNHQVASFTLAAAILAIAKETRP